MKIKMYVKKGQTHCFDCDSAFVPEEKVNPYGFIFIGCPNHNRGTVATPIPEGRDDVQIEVDVTPEEAHIVCLNKLVGKFRKEFEEIVKGG